MTPLKSAILALCLTGLASAGHADTADRTLGGDLLTSGDSSVALQAARDVLAAGPTVALYGTVAQDTHAAGFDVDVESTTGGDLFAVGFSVSLRGPVGGDATASGFSLRTSRSAEIAGNMRLAGARVTIDGPVQGALLAAGGRVTLNAAVAGDAMIAGETINFGPGARIDGTLTYSAPQRLQIPDSVVAADRVKFEPLQDREMIEHAREMWNDWEYPVLPTFLSVLSGFLITLGFFLLIGALFLTLAPVQVRNFRRTIDARPGLALLWGVVGLSLLIGLLPVSALTVVGIPMIPIVLLVVVAVWTLGYILGTYVIAMRAMRAFGGSDAPEIWARLVALVAGVTAFSLLNFIPFVGWIANFALVLLGIGGMTSTLFNRLPRDDGRLPDLDAKTMEP